MGDINMKQELDLVKESDNSFDALLDEINKQKRIISLLQSENRSLKSTEIRFNRASESLKTENLYLKQELAALAQQVRELEIQQTIPTNERAVSAGREIDPYPKKKLYQKIRVSYVLVPILALIALGLGKWWATSPTAPTVSTASISAAIATVQPVTNQVAAPVGAVVAASAAVNDGYIQTENPIEADGMIRVLDGFEQKARVLAWINPNEKYRIRTQSPQKMRRTYIYQGKSITVEDYFYKISDKDQWVHGFFTNKRTYEMPK